MRGAFRDAPSHKVVEWFWSSCFLDAKKAELLRWATGSARCPLGGFAKLRAGRRAETLHADVGGAGAGAHPRAHPCNRPSTCRCFSSASVTRRTRSRSRWTRGTRRRFYGLTVYFYRFDVLVMLSTAPRGPAWSHKSMLPGARRGVAEDPAPRVADSLEPPAA